MKKGAILGIVAAFVIIAMLIFIPVIVENAKAPAETASTDVFESGDPAAEKTEASDTEPDILTDTQTEDETDEHIRVAANAAWHAPSGTLSALFQAGALIELSGDAETAFEI